MNRNLLLSALLLCGGNIFGIEVYSTGFQRASSVPSRASTWYGGYWDDGSSPLLAQQFSLSENAQIDGAQIWTYDTLDGSTGFPIAIRYAIYVGDAPGSQLVSSGFGAITTASDLGPDYFARFGVDSAFRTISTSFSLSTPVTLDADSSYWLALSCLVNPQGVNNAAAWAESGVSGGSYLRQNGDGWDVIQGDRAFALHGEILGVPDAAASLPLFCLSLMSLALIRKRDPSGKLFCRLAGRP